MGGRGCEKNSRTLPTCTFGNHQSCTVLVAEPARLVARWSSGCQQRRGRGRLGFGFFSGREERTAAGRCALQIDLADIIAGGAWEPVCCVFGLGPGQDPLLLSGAVLEDIMSNLFAYLTTLLWRLRNLCKGLRNGRGVAVKEWGLGCDEAEQIQDVRLGGGTDAESAPHQTNA